jgi:hypothetical protein
MFLLSTIQTCPSSRYGSFYLFEPINSIKAFNIKHFLFSREPKGHDVVFTSLLEFQVVFVGYRISGGGVIANIGIVGFPSSFMRSRAKKE